MQLLTNRARAYVYAGMWVAQCPGGCNNVEPLFDPENRHLYREVRADAPRPRRRPVFYCTYCGHVAEIEWAQDEAEIMAVLERRPIPHNRHWYPQGHEFAIRAGIPHGQTVADLEDENREHGVI